MTVEADARAASTLAGGRPSLGRLRDVAMQAFGIGAGHLPVKCSMNAMKQESGLAGKLFHAYPLCT